MTDWDLLVLSPHLDDAAFSCGGAIARATRRGERVLIASFCTADAAESLDVAELSPFARRLHQAWNLGDRPYAGRRAEDLEAGVRLGAETRHLGFFDAPYRRGPEGRVLYADPAGLFGRPAPDDPALAGYAAALAPWSTADTARVWAPLGVGGHVDHRLVRRAAESVFGQRLEYYEDFPYATSRRKRWTARLRPARTGSWPHVAWPWRSRVEKLAEPDLAGKISAMDAFTSQLHLWPDPAAMAAAVRAFAAARGGERLWKAGFSSVQGR